MKFEEFKMITETIIEGTMPTLNKMIKVNLLDNKSLVEDDIFNIMTSIITSLCVTLIHKFDDVNHRDEMSVIISNSIMRHCNTIVMATIAGERKSWQRKGEHVGH